MIVSKACLVGAYQTKLEEIARFDDIELTAVVPPKWLDPAGAVTLERSHTIGYELQVEPIRFNGRFHLYYFPGLGRRLADFQPHIVHIDEEPYNLATWLALRQARAGGASSLFFSWQNLNRRYPPPFSWLERRVLQDVDYAIMGNQDAAAVWRGKGYAGPYRVIPQFGVNPELYRPRAGREEGGVFVVGSANRRLVPEKGVDLLLRAMAGVTGAWRVRIAGDGPSRPELARLASQLGIADRVCFDGVIASEAMPTYLQQLDVLVLSSRSVANWQEQFGRVLVEAMACEIAVIGARSGEIPFVIGDAGLLFAEEDVAELRGQLQQLQQSDSLRQALARRGRLRVLQQFTQAHIAGQTVAVYREIAAARPEFLAA